MSDIEEKMPPIIRTEDGRTYYKVEFADYGELIAQLRAYREELAMIRRDRNLLSNMRVASIEAIERLQEDVIRVVGRLKKIC